MSADTSAPARLALNPALQISGFDGAGHDGQVLYVLADPGGGSRQISLPSKLHQRLVMLDTEGSLDSVLEQLALSGEPSEAIQRFRALVLDYLLPRGFLRADDAPTPGLPARRAHYMAAQWRLLNARFTARLAAPFEWLFQPWVAWPVVALSLAAQLHLLLLSADWQRFPLEEASAHSLLLAGLIAAVCTLLHELGHAAAARRFGCVRTEIGLGWYLYFFVLYADLTESWRLPRWQRAVIDVGGLHVQALCIALLMAIQSVWPSAAVFHAVLLLNLGLWFNLNPFFRMDGYWLASDLLGISNLRARSVQLLRHALDRVLRRPAQPVPAGLPAASLRWLALYAITSSLFFGWFLYLLLTEILASLAMGAWLRLQALSAPSDTDQQLLDALGLGLRLTMLAALAVLLWRLLTGARRLLQALFRR